MSEWISVKEGLPEDNRFVLVCNDDGRMMIAQYIGESIWQWQYKYTNYDVDVWDDKEQGPVCWWMPLPEPPREKPKKRIKDHVCNNDYCELE